MSLLACSSSYYPRLGSLCRVRVQLKANVDEAESSVSERGKEKLSVQSDQSVTEVTEAVATAFPRCPDSVLQVPLGDWTTLRLGEGQCDVTEACVEGMRSGEECEVRVKRGRCNNSTLLYVSFWRHDDTVLCFYKIQFFVLHIVYGICHILTYSILTA